MRLRPSLRLALRLAAPAALAPLALTAPLRAEERPATPAPAGQARPRPADHARGRGATPVEAQPVRFRPEDAAPYFASGPAAEAAAAQRREEWATAGKLFAAYLASPARGRADDQAQAEFLLARAELKLGAFEKAARRFDALVTRYPLLADYHRAWAARALLQSGQAGPALERAQKVSSASALDGEARLTRAEALRVLGRNAEAAEEYRGYLSAYPTSWRTPEARFRLGEALEASNRADEARAVMRQVYLEAPAESWGQRAEGRLRAAGSAALTFDAAELARRAMALFDSMRNAESERAFTKVLEAPNLTDALACQARFHAAQSVFKQRERFRSAPLFDAAAEACAKANDADLTAKALYQSGRAWGQKGDKDLESTRKAVSLFERVWKEHAQHSYADDARLRQAEVLDGIKDEAQATALLAGLPEAFPKGDQRGEALWRLAFRALRKGDIDGARRWLETEHTLLPREEGWWEAGRTLYWLGRVADRQGDGARAAEHYERAAREYPLAYYALQALNRLKERWPERARALEAELRRDTGDPAGWQFQPSPLFGTPAFRRGLELARLGLGPEAKRELQLAGIEVPKKKGEAVIDAAHEELLWLAAVLYDRAGEVSVSHFIPRHVLTTWAQRWPVGENRKRWLLAYPRGYAELIEKHAGLNGQPAALEFAIVREESAFDPLMESFANAIGLTQLTAPPAARFAEGLPHDRQALRDPAINVTIGARELGFLYKLYNGHPALSIAAYNAGEGAVGRWLRDPERAGLDCDAWIEAIPYDETRGYTKRVLSSYFAYLWLSSAEEKIPPLPLALPRPARK